MLRAHPPTVDQNGLIRSYNRNKRLIEVNFNVKHPIILDARQLCTQTIAQQSWLPFKSDLPISLLPLLTTPTVHDIGSYYVTVRRTERGGDQVSTSLIVPADIAATS